MSKVEGRGLINPPPPYAFVYYLYEFEQSPLTGFVNRPLSEYAPVARKIEIREMYEKTCIHHVKFVTAGVPRGNHLLH